MMQVFFVPSLDLSITDHEGYVGQAVIKYGNLEGHEAELSDLTSKYVLHLAARVDEDQSTVDENLSLDEEVYEYCKTHQSHIIYASSNNVYPLEQDCHIDTPLDLSTTSYYAKSKIAGEQLLGTYNTFPKAILRIGDVFGVDQDSTALFKTIQNAISTGSPLVQIGSGNKVRSYIYIEDLARFILCCATVGVRGTFNVCHPSPASTASIIAKVSTLTNLPIEHQSASTVENAQTMVSYRPDTFEYQYDLDQALERFCTLCEE